MWLARACDGKDSTAPAARRLVRRALWAKRTGKAIKYDWVHIFKYKQGRMMFAQEYADTAAFILAMS
jgi:ketosteroid isomerase-like protein